MLEILSSSRTPMSVLDRNFTMTNSESENTCNNTTTTITPDAIKRRKLRDFCSKSKFQLSRSNRWWFTIRQRSWSISNTNCSQQYWDREALIYLAERNGFVFLSSRDLATSILFVSYDSIHVKKISFNSYVNSLKYVSKLNFIFVLFILKLIHSNMTCDANLKYLINRAIRHITVYLCENKNYNRIKYL